MAILGVVPSAGMGKRWGGFFKEFLPVSEKDKCIDRTVKAMRSGGAEKIMIISNPFKISEHSYHFRDTNDVFFTTQKKDLDLYGAVYESLTFAGEYNLFAMPDTIFPIDTFSRNFSSTDLWFGYFQTNKPERFGVILEDRISDKNPYLSGKGSFPAWGVVVWSEAVAKFWLRNPNIKTNDEALNMAIRRFGFKSFPLKYYYDFASFSDYKEGLVNA